MKVLTVQSSVVVLTVHNPYAWAFFYDGKDVENRSKFIKYRGKVFIHSGLSRKSLQFKLPTNKSMPIDFPFGAIVGLVDIVDCVQDSSSQWAMNGYWHWIVENQTILPEPIYCKGQLGLWTPNDDIIKQKLAVYTKN